MYTNLLLFYFFLCYIIPSLISCLFISFYILIFYCTKKRNLSEVMILSITFRTVISYIFAETQILSKPAQAYTRLVLETHSQCALTKREVERHYHNNMRNQIKSLMVRIVQIYANFFSCLVLVTPSLKGHQMVAT